MVELPGRTGQPRGKLRHLACIALPEAADVVAKLVVPFTKGMGETADLVASLANVPWFCNQLDARENGVLPDRAEEAALAVEFQILASERAGKVEAEAVDMHHANPVAQAVEHHAHDHRMG